MKVAVCQHERPVGCVGCVPIVFHKQVVVLKVPNVSQHERVGTAGAPLTSQAHVVVLNIEVWKQERPVGAVGCVPIRFQAHVDVLKEPNV